MVDGKDFTKYLVIFVDILGTRNRTSFDEQYRINEIFHSEFEKNESNQLSHVVYQRRIFTFSDCCYIFYNYKDGIEEHRKDDGKLFTVALCNCEPLFLKFLGERIIFRGGICYGDAYVDPVRSMFFGEAVNRAYELESKWAVHPRILIDDFVAEAVLNNIEDVKYKTAKENPENVAILAMNMMSNMPLTGDGIIEQDEDGRYVYNYLHFPENGICTNEYQDGNIFIEDLIEFAENQINSLSDIKVIDKYHYLSRFYRNKINYGGAGL